MFTRETAELQSLSLQSQRRKGRAQLSPLQIPESIPALLLFRLLFSGIPLRFTPRSLLQRQSLLINLHVSA